MTGLFCVALDARVAGRCDRVEICHELIDEEFCFGNEELVKKKSVLWARFGKEFGL